MTNPDNNISNVVFRKICAAETISEFLSELVGPANSNPRPYISYSELSRRCKFKSRSFIRDLVLKQKTCSLKSIRRIADGLGLSDELRALFEKLYTIERSEGKEAHHTRNRKELNKIRDSLLLNRRRIKGHAQAEMKNFEIQNFSILYASLGYPESGATLSEIIERTGMSKQSVEMSLRRMVNLHTVHFHKPTQRYRPMSLHLIAPGSGEIPSFKTEMLQAIEKLKKKFIDNCDQRNNKDHLFFLSNFSIELSRLPELRAKLRQTMLEFVDSAESPEGDKIAQLTCSLFS